MRLTAILLLLSTVTFAQPAKNTSKFNAYLKIRDGYDEIYCGYTAVEFYFTTKRLVLNSSKGSLDLKVVSRKRSEWKAKDKKGNYYTISTVTNGEHTGMLLLPNDSTGALIGILMMQGVDLCGGSF